MKITNTQVYGIEESVKASGYPMMKDNLSYYRMSRLGKCKPGTGHDCAHKGIIVQADVTASQAWWLQFQRYHFADIVSSESKMHKITEMDTEKQCNQWVYGRTIELVESLVKAYRKDQIKFDELIANVPMGLMLKARITTNYLQLKTIYLQRKNHKLEEWTTFCDWILGLPYFKEFTGVQNADN